MINIDITLLIQLVNFLVALAIINYLIIRPVRGVIARRRAQNDELRGSADTIRSEADLKMEGYTARIAKARAEVAAARESIPWYFSLQKEESLKWILNSVAKTW